MAEEFSDMGDTNSNVNHILAKFFDPMDVFHPIVFQDDLGKVNPDVKSAQKANKRIEDIIEKKLLTFNQKKSLCMVKGHEKARKRLLDQLEKKSLLLCKKKMQTVANLKYLGIQ